MKKFTLFIFLFSAVLLFAAEDNTNATVNASRLNVRMKPTVKSPKAGTLVRGERVRVTGKDGAWVELAAPASLKLYVSEVYLINGKLTNATNLRAGKSAEAPSFGVLPTGTELKTAAPADRFGWVQVVPPENIKVYAYSDYITCDSSSDKAAAAQPETKADTAQVAPDAVKNTEEKTAVKAEKKEGKAALETVKNAEEKTAVKAEKKEIKAAQKTVKKAEEKKAVPAKEDVLSQKINNDLEKLGALQDKNNLTISGTLIRIPASTSTATDYALLKDGKNQGYVCGKPADFFSKNEGKEIKAAGKSYKVPGWKAPIIVIE